MVLKVKKFKIVLKKSEFEGSLPCCTFNGVTIEEYILSDTVPTYTCLTGLHKIISKKSLRALAGRVNLTGVVKILKTIRQSSLHEVFFHYAFCRSFLFIVFL